MENFMTYAKMMAEKYPNDYRKALVRAAKEREHRIEVAGRSLFILERYLDDKTIGQCIGIPVAVSANMENLVAFCRKNWGENVEFDEHNRTQSFETDMGKVYFEISTVAFV